MTQALLEVKDLNIKFQTNRGLVTAVSNLDFRIQQGETVALVGESGCGKSVTSLSIMGLNKPNVCQVEGKIRFKNKDLNQLSDKEMRSIRGQEISMIFQETMSSLNPVLTIGQQIMEVFKIHTYLNARERWSQTVILLTQVGIPHADSVMRQYPHQLSGGMKQRAMIAMAMACSPDLLIADEPTTALDVTIQAQILDLMNEMKRRSHTSILLITHDLGVVAEMADRVMVMYYGDLVEETDTLTLFTNPKHPYTIGLLNSVPKIDSINRCLSSIEGHVPVLGEVTTGCPFRFRCKDAHERCKVEKPPLIQTGKQAVRCWLYEKEELAI
ncbi:ABC transporter ATP-binding protein [Paenibacillus aestuarii]|uniref:ABC transporter ATP-binding protein n=1 Tax=Paenibacillus aestuarii TaxID=516965 RepID=A0ABW0K9E4_9BACL|nr:ABC transporter ATP-binding protein [Paenibacillus aestuarii]